MDQDLSPFKYENIEAALDNDFKAVAERIRLGIPVVNGQKQRS